MRRNFAYWALASAVAALSACGSGDDGHDAGADANIETNNLAALVTLSAEPANIHCVEGSTKVNVGPDANGNGVLDDNEITQTTYVCTGASGATGAAGATGATGPTGAAGQDGQDGKDGQDGRDGLNALMLLSSEMAGANCAFGGTRIDAGLDANGNAVLDPAEVTSTSYVCNAATTPIVLQSGAVQGAVNASYVAADPDAPIALTLPAAPALGDTLSITGAGAGGWVLRQNPGQSILAPGLPVIPSESSWSAMPTQPPRSEVPIRLASSSNGRYLCVVKRGSVTNAFAWSNDGGINWGSPLVTTGSVGGAVAVSADGRCFTVTDSGIVRIRHITTPGVNWTNTIPQILSSMTTASIAVSADGLRVLVANQGVNGDIYRSTDGGLTWASTASVLPGGWAAVGMSADGLQVYGLPAGVAPVAISHDGWRSWSSVGATPAADWAAIAVSGDGSTIIAGNIGGRIYISRDYGLTWEREAFQGSISSLAISHDGKVMLAGTDNGFLYQSGNHGVTWTQVETNWFRPISVQVALSADGSSFFASADDEPILFTRVRSRTSIGDAGFLAGSAGEAVTLQYVGNGEFIVLRYTSNSGSFAIH